MRIKSHRKSVPPLPTFVNDNGEKVTILRTTASPKKAPPPPVPTKKSGSPPILTISSYESNQPPNRFMVNESSSNNRSVITVGERSELSVVSTESKSNEPSNKNKSPIHSIKINLKMPNSVNK
ncbi:hypothetical protein B4U80_00686 [Leptotrombidium deliense]|uniref:Uncharacterized protein n=1 Tax=Leptotrombidium deliense TaxID=299467 RepID=A0A443SRU2_9ACAR|nr:hypothetical protein B4U80_00686 [Leptotrombidium deliense]